MQKLLQVNFRLTIPGAELREIASSLAPTFENLPGLVWKIWGIGEREDEICGWYLFESEDALQAFLSGPIPAQIQAAPFQADFSAKVFNVLADVTARTRGPVGDAVREGQAAAARSMPSFA